jgi:Domain of unknown function (DUF4412)
MKPMSRVLSLATAGCLVAASGWAADGVLIVQKFTINGATQTHQIQIEPRRMRAEMGGAQGGQVVVFDGMHETLLMINDANKTYTEMTKADLDAISSQMAGAMAQMQDAMKNIPPEQRAQMEAMMRGRGMAGRAGVGAAPARPVYKPAGTDTVGKWKCNKYEGFVDGQKTSEVCTVDPSVLGLTAADFAVTKDMAAMFQKMLPAGAAKMMPTDASQMFHLGSAEEGSFSGLPVRSMTMVAGQPVTQEITDVHRQAFPDSLFQPPAGYQKAESPFGRGRRGR